MFEQDLTLSNCKVLSVDNSTSSMFGFCSFLFSKNRLSLPFYNPNVVVYADLKNGTNTCLGSPSFFLGVNRATAPTLVVPIAKEG